MVRLAACYLLMGFLILLIVYVVFSWIPRPPEPVMGFVRLVHRIVNPVVEPFRRVTPTVELGGMGLDLSVLVVFFVVAILQRVVCS
jgi:YggT family protein